MKKLFWFFLFFITSAQAADSNVVSIAQTVTSAIELAGTEKIMPMAISWMGSFMVIQFVVTNFGLLKSGAEIEVVWAKFLGSIIWFAFCFYLLQNGPEFIDAVGGGILDRFAGLLKPGWIISASLALCVPFLVAIGIVGLANTALAMVLFSSMLTVLLVGLMLALKIMLLTIELGLIVMLSPLSFSLLGLNALRDQGIAPLKSLLSLIYRIILLSILCAAFTELISVASQNLKGISAIQWVLPSNWPNIINTMISTALAFPVIGYLIYKSDSLAASLAGGSTSMGTGDVASAAAAGAAAGAAIASGGASAAGAATTVPQSMANFMSKLSGGGSVSNASNRGMGGSGPAANPPPVRPSSSLGAPAFEAGKHGQPLRPAEKGPSNATKGGGNQQAPTGASTAKTESSGSGSGAGISGGGAGASNNDLLKAIQQQSGPRTPTTLDRLGTANHHMSQEKAATHVSINANASD